MWYRVFNFVQISPKYSRFNCIVLNYLLTYRVMVHMLHLLFPRTWRQTNTRPHPLLVSLWTPATTCYSSTVTVTTAWR